METVKQNIKIGSHKNAWQKFLLVYSGNHQRDALKEVFEMVTKNDLKAGTLRAVVKGRFGRPGEEVFPINEFLAGRGVNLRGGEDPTQR